MKSDVVLGRRQLLQGALLAPLAACGYSSRIVTPEGGDYRIHIPLVTNSALDVDISGLVDAHLRREVARTAGLRTDDGDSAQAVLRVEITGVKTQLASFADPSVRAAQYETVVSLKAELTVGQAKWEWAKTQGRAPFLSRAGRLEALDGAGRIALALASEQACQTLVRAASWKLSQL